ncbi:MAG: hypothetical protein EXR76_11870 [Myxococcales bacterium]|nr:hypothetical protein [Myxococcales bacterium]
MRVARAAERHALRHQLAEARAALASGSSGEDDLIGRSPPMARVMDLVSTLAGSDAPVLVTGESGTGKELIARRLHALSPRRADPFIAINCAAFPETLLEGELFGHDKGAFTGAIEKRDGRFKAANGGTLFLDEIAEIPSMAQAKLLRVLQSGTFEPLGTNISVRVDVRLVSATHRNLRTFIAEGRFREDLYYRLNVLGVAIPALRDRRADLPLLVEHFLSKYTPPGVRRPSVSPTAWAILAAHAYPGNIREVQHAIHHAVVLARGIDVDGNMPPLANAMKAFENEYLVRALRATRGKRQLAADLLGISRKNLWEKLRANPTAETEAWSEADE